MGPRRLDRSCIDDDDNADELGLTWHCLEDIGNEECNEMMVEGRVRVPNVIEKDRVARETAEHALLQDHDRVAPERLQLSRRRRNVWGMNDQAGK